MQAWNWPLYDVWFKRKIFKGLNEFGKMSAGKSTL